MGFLFCSSETRFLRSSEVDFLIMGKVVACLPIYINAVTNFGYGELTFNNYIDMGLFNLFGALFNMNSRPDLNGGDKLQNKGITTPVKKTKSSVSASTTSKYQTAD